MTDQNAAEVARIARGLTKAQRRELAAAPSSCIQGFAPVAKLKELGLVTAKFARMDRWHYEASDLGLAVRAHLEGGL